jgi:hypothetical protein
MTGAAAWTPSGRPDVGQAGPVAICDDCGDQLAA